jgi:hypothetical protein
MRAVDVSAGSSYVSNISVHVIATLLQLFIFHRSVFMAFAFFDILVNALVEPLLEVGGP